VRVEIVSRIARPDEHRATALFHVKTLPSNAKQPNIAPV
jgi:hypothetical protein